MNFTKIKYDDAARNAQKVVGVGENQPVLANDLNTLVIYVLNNLNTLLPDAADGVTAPVLA